MEPLQFEETPFDGTFYSPDRPSVAVNPIGAPSVDAIVQSNVWVRFLSFGRSQIASSAAG